MIYFIIAIIVVTVIENYLLKDIGKILRLNSILTIISGYLTIFINHLLRNIINKEISFINVSKITSLVFDRARDRGLMLILLGAIQLIIYIIIRLYRRYYPRVSWAK